MHDPRFPGATIAAFGDKAPTIDDTAFIAPGARVIGDVAIGPGASIWYNCVLRGDLQRIVIGARSNVQDGAVIHVEGPHDGAAGTPALIGADCLIGHMALIHAARLEDGAFVGMGAVAMDGAVIGKGAMLGAGALLSPGKMVPAGQLWIGRPARFLRLLDAGHRERITAQTERYCQLAAEHRQALA